MADKVKVQLVDQSGGKMVNANLPADVPMSQLVPGLIQKMQLPATTNYYLAPKSTNERLGSSDTLNSAGVKDGDILRLLPDVTAGRPNVC